MRMTKLGIPDKGDHKTPPTPSGGGVHRIQKLVGKREYIIGSFLLAFGNFFRFFGHSFVVRGLYFFLSGFNSFTPFPIYS